MPLWITIDDVRLSFEQVLRISRLKEQYGAIHWHPNECGCCVTVHADDHAYVIDQEGGSTHFVELEGGGYEEVSREP